MQIHNISNEYAHLVGRQLYHKPTGIKYTIQKITEYGDSRYRGTILVPMRGTSIGPMRGTSIGPSIETMRETMREPSIGPMRGTSIGPSIETIDDNIRTDNHSGNAYCIYIGTGTTDNIETFHFRHFSEVVQKYGELVALTRRIPHKSVIRFPQVVPTNKWSKVYPET